MRQERSTAAARARSASDRPGFNRTEISAESDDGNRYANRALGTRAPRDGWTARNRAGSPLGGGHPQGPTLPRIVIEALEAGVAGYLLKTSSARELAGAGRPRAVPGQQTKTATRTQTEHHSHKTPGSAKHLNSVVLGCGVAHR